MSYLAESCRHIVATGAAIGQEFSLTRLSAVLDEEGEEPVRQALEEARKQGIIEEITESPNKYRFAHKMIQEVAEREFSGTKRANLHERIGLMLEEQYGADSAKHVTELARHFEQADSDEIGGKTAYSGRLAGEAALSAYTFEEAVAHFSRAIAVKENMRMDDEMARSFFGLGQAQLGLYMLDESLDNLDKAFEYFEKTGDAERMAAIAGQPRLFAFIDRMESRIATWVERSIEVTPDDSPLKPGLLSHRGYLSYKISRDPHQTESVFRHALAISEGLQNPAAEIPIYCYWWALDRVQTNRGAYFVGVRADFSVISPVS